MIFVAGGFWFWSIISVLFIIVLLEVAFEHWAFAAGTIVAGLVAFNFLSDIKVFEWISNHPFEIVISSLIYLVIGVIWAFVRWFLHVIKCKNKYNTIKRKFLKENGVSEFSIPDSLKYKWAVELDRRRSKTYYDSYSSGSAPLLENANAQNVFIQRIEKENSPPTATGKKSLIIQWMAYWPWSMLWYLLADFLIEVYERIYSSVAGALQAISDRVFKDVVSDFTPPTRPIIKGILNSTEK